MGKGRGFETQWVNATINIFGVVSACYKKSVC